MKYTGTEKQIAWAQDIINTFFEILDKDIEKAEASITKRAAKGKKATLYIMERDAAQAVKDEIENAETIEAGRVIEYGKAIHASKDVKGAMDNYTYVKAAWEKINR